MPRTNLFIKIISAAIFIVLILYLAYAAFDAATNDFRTSAVYSISIEDAQSVTGRVIRDEYILNVSDEGSSLLVKDGDKLAFGQHIAAVYSDPSFLAYEDELDELEIRSKQLYDLISGGNSAAPISDSIADLAFAASRGDAAAAADHIFDLEASVFKKYNGMTVDALKAELASTNGRIEELKNAILEDANFISAQNPGVFSRSADGYEWISSKDIEDLTVSEYAELFKTRDEIASNAIGKVITGVRWYYVIQTDESVIDRLGKKPQTAMMKFNTVSDEILTMKVESISKAEEGKCVMVLSCNQHLSEVATARELKGSLVFRSLKGVRIAKEAFHRDPDGQIYIYILRALQAKRIDVTVIATADDYFVIEDIGTDYATGEDYFIPNSAEIIVQAKDLYDGKVVQ